ncbi:Retrotransposon gag protein [Gossypium australe]|uniref:Retrotransposon gag protein n=1 Tax=Gossypium australe TaxID=47621 RepID=A0A5B6W5I5_9ROSI|nr:Retrotransposon gag protein [Gossypium australe]
MKNLQDHFGFGQFGNPMKELVNLKQQGTVEKYQDIDLKTEIGHYFDLFERAKLIEAFQLAKKIEVLLACPAKKSPTYSSNSPRLMLNPSIISGYSSSPTRYVSTSQSVSNASVNKSGAQSIPPAVMAERKQKSLCFWCGAKYHTGHKCFLWEPLSDSEAEKFQECSEKLEEGNSEEEPSKSPVISLHALNGLQCHNT